MKRSFMAIGKMACWASGHWVGQLLMGECCCTNSSVAQTLAVEAHRKRCGSCNFLNKPKNKFKERQKLKKSSEDEPGISIGLVASLSEDIKSLQISSLKQIVIQRR